VLARRYRLDDRIAAGGMGEVWRATDLMLQRPVAVKLLRPGHDGTEEELARFRAEARHAGSLSHPGIARVYDYNDADPQAPAYLVMELVDGSSLASLLDEGPLDPARTMKLVAQAAWALEAAHAVGLVHRDIKPGNLLVTRDGQLKITDFGISRAAGSTTLTRPGTLIGTPAYLAPERTEGMPAMPASDLYSLGIVAFQCLTGELPFTGPPLAIALAHGERPLPPLPPSVPLEVAALVAGLTAKDPGARPGSAGEVALWAEHLEKALTATASRPDGPENAPLGRWSAYGGIATAVVVAVVGVIVWAMTGAQHQAATHLDHSPVGTIQRSARPSHPSYQAAPVRGADVTSAADASSQGPRSTASQHQSPRSDAAPATAGSPASTPAPTVNPASGTPTATETSPSGTSAPTGTPSGPTSSPSSSSSPTAAPTTTTGLS
jgi:serine/threonine-protein kinase